MKSFMALLTATLMVSSACTDVERQPDSQALTIWTITQDGMNDFIAETAKTFEVKYPGVEIVHKSFPNESYKTQIQVALTGSAPPDIFFSWAGEDAARLVNDGLVVDITDYGQNPDGFANSVSEAWLSPFVFGGRNYGVPTDAVSEYFYYDPVFFAENGLSIPRTFKSLVGVCKSIRNIDYKIVPWSLGNSERWKLAHLITMFNQQVLGLDAVEADYSLKASDEELFANPGYVEALSKVLELKNAGCFQDAPNATSPEASRSIFAAQVSPMIYCGTWCGNILSLEGYDGFKMFRFPVLEGGAGDPEAQFLVLNGYMVSTKSERPDVAAQFINHMVSDDQAKSFAEKISGIVSNPSRIDEVELTPWDAFFSKDLAQATKSVKIIDIDLEASVANAYLDAGVEVLNETLNPEQAMEKIRKSALEAKSRN